MATTPLGSARSSSELPSVRDDYSSWLDAIFPPSRGHSQHQHPAKAGQQQAIIAGQLRNALPLELPRPSKKFLARHGTQDKRSNDGDRAKGCVTRGTRRDSSSKRRPPALSLIELSSSLALNYSIGHHHRRQRQGGRHRGQASLVKNRTFSSTLPASTNHPATFSDVRYSNRRSSHRPGLSFFEHIPTQALGGVACTLVFLAPDAATRAGGEVLWLRVNAAGKTQRRVFAKAGCFRSNPRLCRRVALSLSGRHGNDNIAGKARTIGSSGENVGLTKDPAALLKIFRPDNVNNNSSLNTDSDNTRTGSAKLGGRGGGCTDVQLINSVSDIEDVLVNAGDEQGKAPAEGDSQGDAAPPPLQQRQQLPRQILSHSPGRLDYGFVPRTKPRHDASSPVATESGGGASPDAITTTTGPNQAGPITDEKPTAAPYAGCSRSPAGPAATEAETGGAANLQMCSANARGVRRPRPWAVQRFLRPKGPLAWMVRVVWRRHRDSFCWIISDSDPYITSDVFHGGGTLCGANASSAVRSTSGWEAPKVFVAGLVEKLEAETAVTDAATPRAPPRFEKLVADLIQDGEEKWWLTQVKAFRLLRSTERAPSSGSTPSTNACAPSNPAAASVPTSSRLRKGSEEGGLQTHGEDHESEGSAPNAQASRTHEAEDEEPQRCRRHVPRDRSRGAEAADRACSAGSARRARTVVVHPSEDAHPGPVRPRAARFINTSKSFCPGLFCGTETRGKGKQRQPREQERLSASQKIGRGVREQADCGMGADADRAERSQEGSTDTLADALGPAVEEEAGNLDESFAAGDEPMFQLPLKALFVNDEVVEFRKRSLARQKLEALSAAGELEGPASTRVSSAAAPIDFSTPPSERGALSSCSYQASRVTERDDASLVEARALAALRQRDRAVLYDTVQLCGACYRVYGENWRWWLARGVETDHTVKPQPGHTPSLALVAGALDDPGPERRREGRRKRQESRPSPCASATRTGTEAGVDGVMSPGVAATSGEIWWKAGGSVRPSDAALALWLSPTGLPGDVELTGGGQEGGGNEGSVHRIDKGGENVGAVASVPLEHSPFPRDDLPTGKTRSTNSAGAVRRQGDTSTIPAVALEGKPSCKQNGRGGPKGKPPTSTANAFRARLDARLSGILIQGSGRQRADDRSERGSDAGASLVNGAPEKARPASPPFVLASANSKPTLVAAAAAAAAAGTAAATAATHAPGHGASDEFVHETSGLVAGKAVRNADGGPAASALRAVAATTQRQAASEDCATPPQAGAQSVRPWGWENVSLDWKSTERA